MADHVDSLAAAPRVVERASEAIAEAASMRKGTAYRLTSATLGILTDNGRRIAVTVPAGAVVVVIASDGPMVDLNWQGRGVTMFAVDVRNRGQAVEE